MTMFKITDMDIKEFEADLKTFADRAFPFATKATLNRTAFEAMKIGRNDVDDTMVQRNRFTKQSIQVDQARTLNVRRQMATVGSTADYMEVQEFGGTKTGGSIPTGYSAGQEGQTPRTRLPRKPNKLVNIRLKHKKKKGGTRSQRNISAVRAAASSGSKYVFLDFGRRKGIFKVIGGKRRPRIKMVHNMTKQSIDIPRNPWLKPAVDKASLLLPGFYRDALIFQLRRQGLFR